MNLFDHKQIFTKAALAALCCLMMACGGKHRPSHKEIRAAVEASPEIKALSTKPGQEIVLKEEIDNEILYTQSFQHTVNGIEVLGSGISFHFNQDEVESLSSHIADVSMKTTPAVSENKARILAEKFEPSRKVSSKPKLKILPAIDNRPARLIYLMDFDSGEEIWIDAMTGGHIVTLEEGIRARSTVQVRSAQGQGIVSVMLAHDECSVTSLKTERERKLDKKACQKVEASACQVLNMDFLPVSLNPFACPYISEGDQSAKRARKNALAFLDYFKRVHGRESFDGKGSPIVSIVHSGVGYANASWFRKEKVLVYGDGDGTVYKDFTYALDVAAHELTHALIQSSAGLVAFGESGALNESLADYFGEVIEGEEDWALGKKLLVNPETSMAIRSLVDPSALLGQYRSRDTDYVSKPYPVSMQQLAPIHEPCREGNDYCGIHYNATIPGHAWYRIHQEIGSVKAEKLIYIALTHYFHELTTFKQAAELTIKACEAILENDDCVRVQKVFQNNQMI